MREDTDPSGRTMARSEVRGMKVADNDGMVPWGTDAPHRVSVFNPRDGLLRVPASQGDATALSNQRRASAPL